MSDKKTCPFGASCDDCALYVDSDNPNFDSCAITNISRNMFEAKMLLVNIMKNTRPKEFRERKKRE